MLPYYVIQYGAVCSEYVALCININTFVTSKLPGSPRGYYFVTDSL